MKNKYRMRTGDTLYLVAKKFGTTVEMLLFLNPNVDPYNIRIGDIITVYPEIVLAESGAVTNYNITQVQLNLLNTMRMLWEQHIFWTRLTIVSMEQNLMDVDLVTARLMQNPNDIGNVFIPYFGEEAGMKITNLFKEHLIIAAKIVDSIKRGDMQAAAEFERQWYANADQIIDYLSSINIFYDKEELRNMFYEHLSLTKQFALARLSGDFASDIALTDRIERQALLMSDYLAKGIIRRFGIQ